MLNKYLRTYKFKILTLKQILRAGGLRDWFATINLTDAYFHVAIHPNHRQSLRFAFEGIAYEYLVLPFGLSLTPRTFTKCVDAGLTPLRERGIRRLGTDSKLQREGYRTTVTDSDPHSRSEVLHELSEKLTKSQSAVYFSRARNMLRVCTSVSFRAPSGGLSPLPRSVSVGLS